MSVPHTIAGDLVLEAPRRTSLAVFAWVSRLGSDRYRLRLHWSDRTRVWSLSIRTLADDPIVDGVQCATGVDLLGDVVAVGRPPGQLWIEDTTRAEADPGRSSWQSTHRLIYRSPEVAATATGEDVVL